MPYIKRYERQPLEDIVRHLVDACLSDPGRLSFSIYLLMTKSLQRAGTSFAHRALMDGVLGTVHAEFRRHHVFPYEDRKRKDNGDIT
jgi:hypothetical protein